MTLYSLWKERNTIVLGAQAKALNTDWKTQTYFCEECKEQLSPVEEQWRHREGVYFVQPYFAHKTDSTCILKNNESEEHKSRKNKLLALLFLEKIKINLEGFETVIKKEWVRNKEVTRGENRADVLVEFNSFNPIFGNGIVFEVMESEGEESIENKSQLWLTRGYTIVRIYKSTDLNSIIDDGIKINQPYLKWLYKDVSDMYDKLNKLVLKAENLPLQQDVKESTIANITCGNCFSCTADKRNPELFICWKFWKSNRLRRYVGKEQACNFFQPRGEY